MKNYIFMLASALIFSLASCGGSSSQNEAADEEVTKHEEKIANEVEESSEKAKKEAEETEKEVDKLLEDI